MKLPEVRRKTGEINSGETVSATHFLEVMPDADSQCCYWLVISLEVIFHDRLSLCSWAPFACSDRGLLSSRQLHVLDGPLLFCLMSSFHFHFIPFDNLNLFIFCVLRVIGSPAFLHVFLLAGRVRVLPAVPPPTDDRHPLPAADGKLSEQRGNKGDGIGTRKKHLLWFH